MSKCIVRIHCSNEQFIFLSAQRKYIFAFGNFVIGTIQTTRATKFWLSAIIAHIRFILNRLTTAFCKLPIKLYIYRNFDHYKS